MLPTYNVAVHLPSLFIAVTIPTFLPTCVQVDIFDDKGQQAGAHISDLMTAIPSRCCVHTSLPLLAAATASGRVHVFR